MQPDELSLDSLPASQSARVVGISSDFPRSRRERFEDLGLLPGAEISRIHTAPLGDPAAYLIGGGVLCLRAEDSRHVIVKKAAA